MAYKALVADDEYIIRKGIISFLKKYDNIEVVAEAEDGEMALEYAKETQPDILFVDVNMPFLNGLQFVEKLNETQPNAVVIIITGYDNFEYARQALRLGVNDYILKPLMEDVFDQAVNRIIEEIEENNKEQRYLTWAKTMLSDNLDNLVLDFLLKWVEGHLSHEEIIEKMDYLSIDIPKSYMVTLLYLERIEREKSEDKWNDDLLYYAAENIAREIYEELSPTYTFSNSYGNLVLISNISDEESLSSLNVNCCKYIEKYLPAKVTLLQETVEEYDGMSYCYRGLLDKLETIIECPDIIKDTKQYMEDNYSKEEFSLLDAAEYMNISPQHLSRLFKKKMGITFVDYLTRVRTRKAMELLYQNDLKMYEIAEMVGYSSQHYFSSVFKKEMGVSPIEYRKNCNVQKRRKKD